MEKEKIVSMQVVQGFSVDKGAVVVTYPSKIFALTEDGRIYEKTLHDYDACWQEITPKKEE